MSLGEALREYDALSREDESYLTELVLNLADSEYWHVLRTVKAVVEADEQLYERSLSYRKSTWKEHHSAGWEISRSAHVNGYLVDESRGSEHTKTLEQMLTACREEEVPLEYRILLIEAAGNMGLERAVALVQELRRAA